MNYVEWRDPLDNFSDSQWEYSSTSINQDQGDHGFSRSQGIYLKYLGLKQQVWITQDSVSSLEYPDSSNKFKEDLTNSG